MRIALLLSVLVLAACGRVETTGTADFGTFYGRSLVSEATQDGAIALVVHGRPSPALSQAAAAQRVGEEIGLPGWFPPTRLRPSNGGEAYRVVLIFNPVSIAAAANNPCGPLADIATGDGAGGAAVVGAFCSGDRAASQNRGSAPAGAGDAALVALVGQLVTSLFPPENPVLRDDRGKRRGWLFGG